MRVNSSASPKVQNSEVGGSTRAEKSGRAQYSKQAEKSAGGPSVETSAKSEISGRGRDMAKAKSIATNAPDVREDRVAELKRKIANKEYKISPDAIADRMMSEEMSML